MEATMTETQARTRRQLSALTRLTIGAVLGLAVIVVYIMAGVIRHLIPPFLVFAAIGLVVAGLMAMGWRWTPLLGAVYSVLLVAIFGADIPGALADSSSPFYVPLVLLLTLAVASIVGGVAATLQNYRSAERRTARWVPLGVAVLAGAALGAILIGAVPRANASASISPETLNELSPIKTVDFKFDKTEIRAKVGETVVYRLDNLDATPHSFDIDEFNVHLPMYNGTSNVALFRASKPGTYTFYCALPNHADKAAKTGMVGTLIVE